MDRQVTPLKQVTSPTWGPPPPCNDRWSDPQHVTSPICGPPPPCKQAGGKAKFTRHWTTFRPAEKFDRTLRSHGTVQYFYSVHREL